MKSKRPRKPAPTPPSHAPFFSSESRTNAAQRGGDDSFFQTKLEVGRPGDVFEREADAVADDVVSRSTAGTAMEVQAAEDVQRQPALEEERERTQVQRQAVEEEEEPVQRQAAPEEEEERMPVQRQATPEEEEEPVQAKAAPNRAAAPIGTRLARQRGKGSALPPQTRAEMETAFGTDFSGVRVHTDHEAAQMNQELGALAFTQGQDVFFDEGKFEPDARSGKHLLAHELTHVVQQRGREE